jgi:hypothetical protein
VIEAIKDKAPAITEIRVRGRGVQYGQPFDACGTFRELPILIKSKTR